MFFFSSTIHNHVIYNTCDTWKTYVDRIKFLLKDITAILDPIGSLLNWYLPMSNAMPVYFLNSGCSMSTTVKNNAQLSYSINSSIDLE